MYVCILRTRMYRHTQMNAPQTALAHYNSCTNIHPTQVHICLHVHSYLKELR